MTNIIIEDRWWERPIERINKRERISYEYPDIRFVTPGSNCELLAINLTEKHMFLVMAHCGDEMYKNGGWVRIHPEIFVRESFTENIWPVKRIMGVPVYPDKHEYTAESQYLEFTLVFDRLPEAVYSFDLIEKEPSDNTFFNFYGVRFNSKVESFFDCP